jgi:hypothetical protein
MARASLRQPFTPLTVTLTVLWAIAVAIGMGVLIDYETRPGEAATAPQSWPESSIIHRDSARPQLVMFAHPRCPCTRASIGELALIMARTRDRLAVQVLFLKPDGFDGEWAKSDLWRIAGSIPGVKVAVDVDGEEAGRFGAKTSGQTMLYDAEGQLLFSGGITASRGHSGDNVGRSTVVSLLEEMGSGEKPESCSAYGCALLK